MRNMIKRSSLLVLSLVFIFSLAITATELKEAEVLEVADGDTIRVRIVDDSGMMNTSLRYIGIDTPETHGGVEYYGREATNYNKALVEDRTVWLEIGKEARDKYGRLLAYVYLDPAQKSMVNAILAAQGFAEVMTIKPNDKFAELFERLVNNAKEGKRGQWGEKDTENNWEKTKDPGEDKSKPVEGVDSCLEILNNSSQGDFEDITGIGEGIAERLVNAQPFGPCNSLGCIETNLKAVSYVGGGRAEDLLEHLCPDLAE